MILGYETPKLHKTDLSYLHFDTSKNENKLETIDTVGLILYHI
jgi:hypothetical protein